MSLDVRKHYDSLIMEAYKKLEPVFEGSDQAVYLYFEADYIACNQKFADMLGYNNAKELMSGHWPFLRTFVANESQEILSKAYQQTMDKLTGSVNEIKWKKKDGSMVNSQVIMVPFLSGNHVMVLHFISSTPL